MGTWPGLQGPGEFDLGFACAADDDVSVVVDRESGVGVGEREVAEVEACPPAVFDLLHAGYG